ncbi:hypothetical protein SteCoe_20557 [Stentor coeruleus]|uniref:Glutamate--cysteine ligase n=1 Tax=Stentor coeruleus TaxID=5963 RepID=A0A1R2BRL8_9CILI|nr:hypothetical protein SteCoe_20557 [Stentor coeruleus]
MGFLEAGASPLTWEKCAEIADYIRQHGAVQFLNLYRSHSNDKNDLFYWGYEMEYHTIYQESLNHPPKLYIKAAENAIKIINGAENQIQGILSCHMEYGAWMIECVPKNPYTENLEELLSVRAKLELSRKKMLTIFNDLNSNVFPITLPCFPFMGIGDYFYPKNSENTGNSVSSSIYLDDDIICPHPRFSTLTKNIIARRGRPLEMYAPLFIDEFTSNENEPKPGLIHMDASGFGIGMCCMHITVNAKSIHEARYLHDQYVPLGPIMLALSACTPYFKGKLSDFDSRWSVLSQSLDDRTEDEVVRSVLPRCSPSALYLSQCITNKSEYNDVSVNIHQPTYMFLLDNGIDEQLAKHIAYIFSRDPLVIFSDKIELDDMSTTNHFENFQSTNWNSVRFKPPPNMNSNVGWRVEFRTMDIQLSDFENAAYAIFIVLLARMIVSLGLNFQIPMSKVHENFEKAVKIDAVLNEKFWFKTNIVTINCNNKFFSDLMNESCNDKVELMSLKEIFCGNDEFIGLLGFVDKYLKEVVGSFPERYDEIAVYLNLIRKRATGELPTGARYLRNFICNHQDYRKDSLITPRIASDIVQIAKDEVWIEELLGPYVQHH